MNNPSFGQALNVLNLVHQKKQKRDELEAFTQSGLLSDLLDCDISLIKRNDFREFIGLPKIGFRFFMDYNKDLGQLLDASGVKGVSDKITRENIPSQKQNGKQRRWIHGELHTFVRGHVITGLDHRVRNDRAYLMSKLHDRGVRGATFEELLTFKAAFPREDRQKVFAPGSPTNLVASAYWVNSTGESTQQMKVLGLEHDYLASVAEGTLNSYYMLAIRE